MVIIQDGLFVFLFDIKKLLHGSCLYNIMIMRIFTAHVRENLLSNIINSTLAHSP